MADEIGLKKRNCHFGSNLRLSERDVERIGNQQINTKKPFNILCFVIILIISLNILLVFD